MTVSPSSKAASCASIDEIRHHIDRMDRQIVPLLAERLAYVEQAATFKPTRADVVVPWRVEAVVQNAKSHAASCAMDLKTIETVYRAMVSASIDRESQIWDDLHSDP